MSAAVFIIGIVLMSVAALMTLVGVFVVPAFIMEVSWQWSFIKKAGVFVAPFVLAAATVTGGAFALASVEKGTGEEVGYITAIQRSGAIWPTPDMYIKTDLDNSETYKYCVDHDYFEEQYEFLKQAQEDGSRVKVHYVEMQWWHPWTCNDGPMITSVEVIGP